MKVKDIDALREQISHDPREVFTKHQVWLLVSEYNTTTPTFDAVPKSVLQDIKAEIAQVCAYSINYPNWEYAKGLQKAIEIIDKYNAETEPQESEET